MSSPVIAADVCAAQPPGATAPIGDEADRALLDRSVEIIRAAQRGDRAKLQAMVPAGAQFTIWNYDSGVSGASGPEGALEFAKALTPGTFEAVLVPGGSLAMASMCAKHEVKVRFRHDGGVAYLITCSWDKGRLVSVDANYAQVFDGKIGSN
ncbi:MAG TPA: hypothetical protein VFW39_06630 [Sphingomicrobium sp.]|nr:hypothetical protein [Sphingomicrobium sp.]